MSERCECGIYNRCLELVENGIDFAIRPSGIRTRRCHVVLKPFKLEMIDAASLVVIIGHRQSGRSTLMKDILRHFRTINVSDVIVDSDRDKYRRVVPACSVLVNPDIESVLGGILQRQSKQNVSASLVMDNPPLYHGWQFQNNMHRVLTAGPQLNLMRLFSLSYVRRLDEEVKANIDWIFVFEETIYLNKEYLYVLCNCFPNRTIFDKVLEAVTKDYGCLVIDRRRNEAFWYRAKL